MSTRSAIPAETVARAETPTEAAERYRVHPRTITRMIARGELPAYRVGRAVRLDPAEVDAAFRAEPNRDPAAEAVAAYVARVVDDAPPLTAEQRSRLTSLLAPSADRHASGEAA